MIDPASADAPFGALVRGAIRTTAAFAVAALVVALAVLPLVLWLRGTTLGIVEFLAGVIGLAALGTALWPRAPLSRS